MAGLAPAAPGYRRLRIAPLPGGGITQAGARLHTPYGIAEVSWVLSGRELTVEAVVPPNTTAGVVLPGGRGVIEVGSGSHTWTVALGGASICWVKGCGLGQADCSCLGW
ncbi:alpha-L-rhamnosidase C-terminal domain-containing protein [Streptomyces sp. UG1]|uniref:alpha-L-rhamnosidase C-terminal domain-containing protein n=1 Tax=Streptomyces sp. UG1 TaxID=3417652 RepID=UPI003CEF7FEF